MKIRPYEIEALEDLGQKIGLGAGTIDILIQLLIRILSRSSSIR